MVFILHMPPVWGAAMNLIPALFFFQPNLIYVQTTALLLLPDPLPHQGLLQLFQLQSKRVISPLFQAS